MEAAIIKISDYTKKTDGRIDGKFSGERFLEEVLWPIIKTEWIINHNRINIIFDNVKYRPGFIDQAFSKLVSKYKFYESKDCFILTSMDKNIIADVMAAIVGAEFITFGKIYTK